LPQRHLSEAEMVRRMEELRGRLHNLINHQKRSFNHLEVREVSRQLDALIVQYLKRKHS